MSDDYNDYDDHDPFRVEADYLEEPSTSYLSEYKKEIVFAGTTTGLLATGYACWNADKIVDFLQGI